MKNTKKLILVILLIVGLFNIIKSQQIIVNTSFVTDEEINPFTGNEVIYGLNISGSVQLNSDTSIVRIILVDSYENEYLVFESYPLIDTLNSFSFTNKCEETCLLDATTPQSLKIQIINAQCHISKINMSKIPIDNLKQLQAQLFQTKLLSKISIINKQLKAKGMIWRAGETFYSHLSYADKKKIFGEKYNLQGFEYYISGFYEFSPYEKVRTTSTYVKNFDWRNRHRANNQYMADGVTLNPYYDGDPAGSGWMTPVKCQQGCYFNSINSFECYFDSTSCVNDGGEWRTAGTCWAFTAVGALEGVINLYYNQHFDFDLSEQEMVSCCWTTPTLQGSVSNALSRIKNFGIVNESWYPYIALKGYCNSVPPNPPERISINNYADVTLTEEKIKSNLILYGPLPSQHPFWPHAMVLVGYGIIKEGDYIDYTGGEVIPPNSSYIGQNYWIFKNSVGAWPWEFNRGYIYMLGTPQTTHRIQTPINSLIYTEQNIQCLDADGDGFYNWGIGPKPLSCPTCPDEEDCDDSDPLLGPYDENYNCMLNCDYFTYSDIPLEITSDKTWYDVRYINSDLIVKSGNTLTIREKIGFIKQAKIIIEPGAKLILDGGTLTNACGTMWQGIEVWGNRDLSQYPQSNQGVVELKNGATIENARCAITTCQKDAVGNILWAYTGGIIHAKDANFINNRKAIEFLSYHNILPNGREIDNSSYFNNCTFETNAQLSDPGTLPETFVSLNDVKGVKFLGCTFQNTAPTGVYSTIHRGNGITSVDANYEVKPSCLNPYIYPCSEYQPNTFQNLYYGIYASNTNPAITLTINGNNFDNNHRSIFLKGINNATITKNNFDIGATIGNINDQTNEREECEACDVFNRSYSYGVYLKECSGYKVEENNFSTSHDGHAGIIVNNSGTKANEIYNNTFDKLAIGTQAQGVNAAGGVIISKSSNPEHIGINVGQGLQFLCNQYFNISSADIAVTSGRIAQKQGYCHDNNPALPAGNKFSHNCISTSDIHVNSDASKFNYNHHSEPDDYVPQCYSSDKVTLHNCDIEYYSQISCPSHLNSGLTPVVLKQIINTNNLEIEELISLIDNGETETLLAQIHQDEEPERIKNALESASPYLSDRVLLAAIKEKPTPLPPDILKEIIISNSPVTDTVMSALNTLKLPDDIQQQIQEVRTGTSARAELEQQISYMESQKDIAENELMRQYLNDTTINGIDSIIAYLETQRDLINKKQLVQAYLVANQCEKAKILLEQLPQENDEDKNFYNFYNLLSDLCVSEKTYFELTSAQEQTVREIAKSETSVSVNAQAILSMVYNEKFPEIIEELKFIVDLRNAPQQGETLGDNITKQIQFVKIYPNPAENTITIELSAELDNKNISVEIYNYLGQKVIFYNFAGDLLNTLDVSDLSNGIYIFKILVGNKIIAREKVVIEK